jgi:hypothetical protein
MTMEALSDTIKIKLKFKSKYLGLVKVSKDMMIGPLPSSQFNHPSYYHRLLSFVCNSYFWDYSFAITAIDEYFRFLELKIIFHDIEGDIILPSPLLDRIWHLHTRMRRIYSEDCKNVCHRINRQTSNILIIPKRQFSTIRNESTLNQMTRIAYISRYEGEPDPQFWSNEAMPCFQISNLKSLIYSLYGIPENQQVLIYQNTPLQNEHSLSWYGMIKDSVIHIHVK